MFEGIKRIVRSPSGGGDLWDADRELEPEAEVDFEFPAENTVLVSPVRAAPKFFSNNSSGVEYQRSLVLAAIEQGGKFGKHEISLPWLRTILAGLEGRTVEPDSVWRESETRDSVEPRMGPGFPSYYALFPAETGSTPAA